MSYPDDCLVTMEQLHDLEQGKTYIVKVRDIENVRPESRGETFTINFRDISPSAAPMEEVPTSGFPNDPRAWMVNGHAADGSTYVYGFHAWLIESIEPA
jgi:hypothetical protein